MIKPVSPDIIYNGFLGGDLNKEKAAELLMSLIEMSEIAQIRIKSLTLLKKVKFKNPKIYNMLEDCLVSDENPLVRAATVDILINSYLDESLNPIIWALEHDKSPLVIKTIIDFFDINENPKYKLVTKNLTEWIKDFSSTIGITPNESRFFLDVEAIFARDKGKYEIKPQSYKQFENLSDLKGGEPWLLKKDGHVEILNFTYDNWKFIKENEEIIKSLLKLNDLEIYLKTINRYIMDTNYQEIPTSIGSLTNVKKLILRRNFIKTLPTSIKDLKLLKVLDLSYNNLNKIPPILNSLNSLEKVNLKHNDIQIIPNSLSEFISSLTEFLI